MTALRFHDDLVLLLRQQEMLSAIIDHLPKIIRECSEQQQNSRLSLLVAAYPDLKPWQIQAISPNKASIEPTESFNEFYYKYLSLLLDPESGNDSARRVPELVRVSELSRYVLHIVLFPELTAQ